MPRRIKHAARNTAAAPLRRRSSLERPCKIRFFLLSIGRLWNNIWNHFGSHFRMLQGSLGHHLESFGNTLWAPKLLMLASWVSFWEPKSLHVFETRSKKCWIFGSPLERLGGVKRIPNHPRNHGSGSTGRVPSFRGGDALDLQNPAHHFA